MMARPLRTALRPFPWIGVVLDHRQLTFRLARRELQARYRGSLLGLFWAVLVPLSLLGIYTLVFGSIFKARWTGSDGTTQSYAVLVFLGLIVFQFFAENIGRAPSLVLENVSYVKKVVFPLQVLPWVTALVAAFNACLSLVLLGLLIFVVSDVPLSVVLLPLVLAPLVPFTLGVTWLLAGLGVYLRDLRQFVGILVTALNFASPVFYPLSLVPEDVRTVLRLNPLVGIMENARAVAVYGDAPDWGEMGIITVVSLVVAAAGHALFCRLKGGFADVV